MRIPGEPKRAGVFTISITPFTASGEIDEAAFRRHLQRFVVAGMGAYVGGGGSGEGYTLSETEMRRVLDIAVSEMKGKAPIRAMGKEPRTAAEMIAFCAMAKDAGVDAVQVYSLDVGHGHQPTAEEIDDYFSEVLSVVQIPAIVSTHQSVGYRIAAEVIAGLVKRFKIVEGVNCSHADLGYLRQILDGCADNVPVLVGGPMQGLVCLAMGGHGYLTSEGNLAPQLCVQAIKAYKAGDLAGCMGAFGRIVRASGLLYENGGIRMTKAVLNKLGLPGGYPRKPRKPVKDDKLAQVLAAIRMLEIPELASLPA